MALVLRILREIVQALMRMWTNVAETITASANGINGKRALAETGFSSPSHSWPAIACGPLSSQHNWALAEQGGINARDVPEIRCKTSRESIGKGGPPTSPPTYVAT